MNKRVRLVFPGENVVAIAELQERDAPRTCEAIWNTLPVDGDLIHAMWSGPETYFPIDPAIRVEPEHQSTNPLPGEIGYYSFPGGRIVGWPDDFAEVAFFYGRGSRPSMPTGPVAMNIFARILENLEEFSNVCARIHKEGVKHFRMEKAATGRLRKASASLAGARRAEAGGSTARLRADDPSRGGGAPRP